MSLQNTVIGMIALAALALGGLALSHRANDLNPLGAASSPAIVNGCQEVNGVTQCFARQPFKTATTTPCVIKSPAATSTLVFGGARITVASSTATTWDIARATTPYATTTALGTAAFAGGAQGTIVASSTGASPLDPVQVFPPNTYLVFGVRLSITPGDAGLGSNTAGTCSAQFNVI